MSSARSLVASLSYGIGFWVLASFAGTMLDPARAEPWTTSLMWALLAAALIAPALLVAYHHARNKHAHNNEATRKAPSLASSRNASAAGPKPFIEETPSIANEDESSRRQGTLWPEPESKETQPASESWPYVREDVRPQAAA